MLHTRLFLALLCLSPAAPAYADVPPAATAPWACGKAEPDAVHRARQADPTVIVVDVRQADAFKLERIAGAINVPVASLRTGNFLAPGALRREREVYLYCACPDEHASLEAAQLLHDRFGFTRLHVIVGGLYDWADTGLPVEKGAKGK